MASSAAWQMMVGWNDEARVVERRRRDVVNSRYRTGRKFPGREAITPRGAREEKKDESPHCSTKC